MKIHDELDVLFNKLFDAYTKLSFKTQWEYALITAKRESDFAKKVNKLCDEKESNDKSTINKINEDSPFVWHHPFVPKYQEIVKDNEGNFVINNIPKGYTNIIGIKLINFQFNLY